MKKTFLIPIFLLQFLIFLNINRALGQDEGCRDVFTGKLKIVQCWYTSWDMQQVVGGRRGERKSMRNKNYSMYYSLDGGNLIHFRKLKDLAPILTSVPESKFFYDRIFLGKRMRWYGTIGGLVAGFAVGFAIGTLDPNGSIPIVGYLPVTILVAGIVVPQILWRPKKDFASSVETYNRVASKKTSFFQPLKPDYLTLGNAQGTAGISIGWHLER